MKSIILAGGYATRLRPLSCSKPKLLFPIVGTPLIDVMVDWLAKGGVSEVILAVNHLSDRLRQEIGNNRGGVDIRYSVEKTPLGTAGPLRLAKDLIDPDEEFIVLNGDIVSNMELRKMIAAHEQAEADATLALVRVPDPAPYGLVKVEQDWRILSFEEKTTNVKGPGLVNAGIYILDPDVLEFIPDTGMVSIERQVFPRLSKERVMKGWQHSGYWYDIGKIPDYIEVNKQLLGRSAIQKGAVAEEVKLQPPYHIGRGSSVEARATLGPYSILSDNVTVKPEAHIDDSIIFESTTIGESSRVGEGSIIGENVQLGKNVRVGKGSIIAGQISIPEGRRIEPGSRVFSS